MATANPTRRTEKLNAVRDAFTEHEDRVKAQVRKLLPGGTRVSWVTQRGAEQYRHFGHVLWHEHRIGSVRVENERTGKASSAYFGRHGTLRVEG